jgi:hypothetical protein
MGEFNRFYQDVIVRQIAYGAAPDRGRTLLELLELLDPLILPEAIDEIGMSQDRSASASLIALATAGEAHNRPPFVQLKAIESLGRLRDAEAVPVLRTIVEDKKALRLQPASRIANCRHSVALQDRSSLRHAGSGRKRPRSRRTRHRSARFRARMPLGPPAPLRTHHPAAHALGHAFQFLGKVEHRHA